MAAGYPSGISSSAVFGTVSFNAKKAGSGTITLGNNSLAFEVSNQSALSGAPVSFTITTIPAVTAPKPSTTQNPVTTPSQNEAPITAPAQSNEQPVAQQPTPSTPLAAAIGGIFTLGTGNMWIGILVGLIILAIIVYLIYILIQRKKQTFGKI